MLPKKLKKDVSIQNHKTSQFFPVQEGKALAKNPGAARSSG